MIWQLLKLLFFDATFLIGLTWGIAAFLLLLSEILFPGLYYFIALACGSLFACIATFFQVSLGSQVGLFFAGTLFSFLILKRISTRSQKHNHIHTNVTALIGQQAEVIRTISMHQPGLVRIGRETWSAAAEDHIIIERGTLVRIVRIQGNKVIVRSS